MVHRRWKKTQTMERAFEGYRGICLDGASEEDVAKAREAFFGGVAVMFSFMLNWFANGCHDAEMDPVKEEVNATASDLLMKMEPAGKIS